MDSTKFISPLVERQLPAIYREESPLIVAFLKSYYEWAEQDENFIKLTRSLLEYRDIDTTLSDYGEYFRKKYLSQLPDTFTDQVTDSLVCTCRRFMVKHVLDLYRSKGTERGYKILFRSLYNQDVDFYYPGRNLLRASDGSWTVPTYVEVIYDGDLSDFEGRVVQILNNPSNVALCNRAFSISIGGSSTNILFLENITGTFNYGERITPLNDNTKVAKIVGSLTTIQITSGGGNFSVGDIIDVQSENGIEGLAVVRSTVDSTGGVTFKILSGGYGYTTNAVVFVTSGGGTGASFRVGSLANAQSFSLINDTLLPYVNASLAFYGANNTGTVSATANQTNVIGVGTLFTTELAVGNVIYVIGENAPKQVASITNNTHLVVNAAFTTTISGNTYVEANATMPGTVTITAGQTNVTGTSTTFTTSFAVNDSIKVGTETRTIESITNSTLLTVTAAYGSSWAANVYYKDFADYSFPSAVASKEFINTRLKDAFSITPTTIGRIDSLTRINPGVNYTSNPTVSVVEPAMLAMRISDGAKNFWGNNAVIEGTAGDIQGIITSVKVIDSGFGYRPGEGVNLVSNSNPAFLATGITNVDRYGKKQGYFKNTNGFLNSDKYLIDSFYFQEFSYELQTERDISYWGSIVNDSIHQAGTKMFGKVVIQGEDTSTPTVVDNVIEQV